MVNFSALLPSTGLLGRGRGTDHQISLLWDQWQNECSRWHLSTVKGAAPLILCFSLHEGIFPFTLFFSVQRWSRISQARRLCTGTQSNDGLGFAALSHISHRLLCQPKDRFGQDMTIKKSEAFKSIHPSVISLSKFWLKFSWKIYKVFTLLMLHLWQNKSGIFHVQLNQKKSQWPLCACKGQKLVGCYF